MKCSFARLQSALAGKLPADEETALHQHLDACDECSTALEGMAGGPAWCRETAALLAQDEFDDSVPAREEWSEIDFTVEHLEPADEPGVLGRLGGYDVLEIIGHGGMGVVLKAYDRELKRTVAIKVLAPHLARNSLARKRFAREAQAAAAVVHPHVLAIHQVQAAGRLPFLVMPLVAGESLAERLAAQGTLELKEILRIGMQAAAGLAAAHEQGLVHRDVKPANILLEKGVERAVLTDFGLARAADDVTLTRWGVVAGTPQYMSPEQARGEPLDGRSDLFSLGCVLYEMATGVSPFRTESPLATMRRLVDDSPQPIDALNPEMPPWFVAIVHRLLEKDPSHRFQSAAEVSELLEECLAHVQRPAAVPLPDGLTVPRHQPDRASGRFTRKPWASAARLIDRGRWSKVRLIAGVATALAVAFAGVVIVLETNKGTVTIRSEAGDVPVRITQDNEVVEELTVTQTGESVRIAAGHYRVELLTPTDQLVVKNGDFMLSRGDEQVATIEQAPAKPSPSQPVRPPVGPAVPPAQAGESRLWNQFGVTPEPVAALTAKVLEWMGLHLRPITKDDFREKNVLSKYSAALDVTFVRTGGPAEKAGVHEVDIVVGLQNRPLANLRELDEAVQKAVDQIEHGDGDSLQFDVLRNGDTVRVNVAFPAKELSLQSSDNAERIAKQVAARIEALKGKYPYLEDFSASKHLRKNEGSDNYVPALFSIVYRSGVVKSPPESGSKRVTSDPRSTTVLRIHFYKVGARSVGATPPYRIGDLSIHVEVDGPAAESIRQEIRMILEQLGAERPGRGRTETPLPPSPRPALPRQSSADGGRPTSPEDSATSARETDSATAVEVDWVAREVATRIEQLKSKYPPLQEFSAAKHLRKNTDRDGEVPAPGTIGNPELYSISYHNGVLGRKPSPSTGPRRAAEFDYDPETGIHLNVHFFQGDSRGNDLSAPYRIGDLNIHVHVRGPAADPIRREIVRRLEELGAVLGSPLGALAPPQPTGPPGTLDSGRPNSPDAMSPAPPSDSPSPTQPPVGASADNAIHGPTAPATPDSSPQNSSQPARATGFPETKELVLSMNSNKFMLDLDTGDTMDPPATIRPEQAKMDLSTTQVQPYHYPTGLVGHSLQGKEVKPSDWNASTAEVRRALAGDIYALKGMDVGPEKNPTYFFKTRDGALGILQLIEVTDEPKGIRLRYKTILTSSAVKAGAMPNTTRQFHTDDNVHRIAFSTDGKLLAIANGNPTFILQTSNTSRLKDNWKPSAQILDAGTGATKATLKLSTPEEDAVLAATEAVFHFEVTALAFSPVEDVVAVGTSIGQVKFFNTRTGELIRSLDDEKPRLADKATPETWKPMKRAIGRVESLAFSPDGSLLAVCGRSFTDFSDVFDRIERGGLGRHVTGPGRLKVFDIKTGALKHDLARHSHAFDVAFSSDGSLLASAGRWEDGDDHGNGVLVWNPQTGEKLRTILIEANGGTHHVAFSPDKKLIATGSLRFDKENDTSSTTIGLTYPLSGITEWQRTLPGWGKPLFSDDGKTLAVLSGGQSINIINVETGQTKQEPTAPFAPPGARFNDIAVSQKARKLAVGGIDANRRGFVTVWPMGDESTPQPKQSAGTR